jgi:hypothetical protein
VPAASEEERSLAALMTAVLAAGTERRLAHLTLADDPFVHRLTPEAAREAVGCALSAGHAAAEMVTAKWGRDPEGIAACLQIPITKSEQPARTGRAVLFSEYGNRPPSIILHMHSVGEANRLIHEHNLEGMLGVADVGPVHLAHELYHHLEGRRLTPGTAGFRIQTGRLGPFRFRTSLPSLSEIAADGFGGAVLGLTTPPKALSFLTIHALNSEYAWGLLQRLRSLPE